MSHLSLHVQQSDCLSAEEKGLRGRNPPRFVKRSPGGSGGLGGGVRGGGGRRRMAADDSWRWESAASSESVERDSCSCCWPLRAQRSSDSRLSCSRSHWPRLPPPPPSLHFPLLPPSSLFSDYFFFFLLSSHSSSVKGQALTSWRIKVLQHCRKEQRRLTTLSVHDGVCVHVSSGAHVSPATLISMLFRFYALI